MTRTTLSQRALANRRYTPALITAYACFLTLAASACTDEVGTETGDEQASDTSGETDVNELPPLELTPTLCEDPSNAVQLMELLQKSGGEGAFGGVNQAQLQRMLAAPTEGPFYMVNLIRYREWAIYPDGRDTNLTGREANALYSPTEFLQAIGARVVFTAPVHNQIDGSDILWEDVAIVEYPCPLAFLAMSTDPGFQERAIHKQAGVEKTIVMVTDLVPIASPSDPDQSEAAFPPTVEDPAFDLIHVMDFHEIAQYEPNSGEPQRSGRAAWEMYQAAGADASNELGHYQTAVFEVQGVFTGDERPFEQIMMVRMSSMAGFQALLADPTREQASYHRRAALAYNYSMITYPTLSAIPFADGDPGGGSSLVVTEDGVGTPCLTDADCPGGGVATCLSPTGGAGFCTREGCGAGGCLSPYLCCHDCAEAAAATLPFEGSACLPKDAAAKLSVAPMSCTCD